MHNKTGFTGNIQFYLKIKARLQWLSVLSSMSLEKRDGARPENLSGQVVMQRAAATRWRLLLCQNLGGRWLIFAIEK